MPKNAEIQSPLWKKAVSLVALVTLGAVLFQAPVDAWLGQAMTWQDKHPIAAPLLYVAFVTVATPLMVPGSVQIMIGGFLFGAVAGFGLAAVGVALGATVACVVARRVARDAVLRWVAQKSFFASLEAALQSRGFFVVLLTRFSLLIPFNVLNYAYGVSSVTLRQYVPATALGMLPAVALFSYLGSAASNVDALLNGNATDGVTGHVVMAVGVVAMILATVLIHRTATAELKKHLPSSEA